MRLVFYQEGCQSHVCKSPCRPLGTLGVWFDESGKCRWRSHGIKQLRCIQVRTVEGGRVTSNDENQTHHGWEERCAEKTTPRMELPWSGSMAA